MHDPSSLCYDPYKIINDHQQQHSTVPINKEVYIVSAFGIVRNISNGFTESTSLISWQREVTIFKGLRTIPFFRMFVLLKVIRRWKSVADRQRHDRVRVFLLENLIQQVRFLNSN